VTDFRHRALGDGRAGFGVVSLFGVVIDGFLHVHAAIEIGRPVSAPPRIREIGELVWSAELAAPSP